MPLHNRLPFLISVGIAALLFGFNATCRETTKETKEIPVQGSDTSEAKRQDEPSVLVVSDSINAFAWDIYGHLSRNPGNLFFSPYSISTALAMTYAGAKGNTQKEMASVLHFDADQKRFHTAYAVFQNRINAIEKEGDIKLKSANSLWLQKKYAFLQPFLNLTEKKYGAGLFTVNFVKSDEARKKINLWIEEKTEGKIQDLIPQGLITRLTKLILANAIYFKGTWESTFDTSRTKDGQFYCNDEVTVTVPFMYKNKKFNYVSDSILQVLELPYKEKDVSMVILLPKAKQGLSTVEQSLSLSMLKRYCEDLSKQKIKVFFPKFALASSCNLKSTLTAMGMTLPFSRSADFRGMTKKKELFIDEVIHKAFIDVNEEGTEAAAATGVAMRTLAMPMPPEEFRADHPFIFIIRDNNSGSFLFMGRMANPKNEM